METFGNFFRVQRIQMHHTGKNYFLRVSSMQIFSERPQHATKVIFLASVLPLNVRIFFFTDDLNLKPKNTS